MIEKKISVTSFALALPFIWFAEFDPRVPFSIYVRAAKPEIIR